MSRTEDRGHDAADRCRAPVHVAVELGSRRDANTGTVDPHRPYVASQLVEGKLEAYAGVDQRSDHRVIGRPFGQPAFQRTLPGVEGGEARGGFQTAALPVDDLVRAAHEPVQRMDRGSNVGRKPQYREVEGGVVAAEQTPACGVGCDGRLREAVAAAVDAVMAGSDVGRVVADPRTAARMVGAAPSLAARRGIGCLTCGGGGGWGSHGTEPLADGSYPFSGGPKPRSG